jgi:hypothetical protein
LVVDTALETGRAPVDELDGTLGLDGGNSGVDVLGDDITTVHHTAGHVLTVTGVTLAHHAGGLESRVGDFSNGELFVVRLLGRDDRGVRAQHKVDTGVRHQVSLELSDIDVEGTIETQRRGQGRDHLGDDAVDVGVSGTLDTERAKADIVHGFVGKRDGDSRVLGQGEVDNTEL